MKVNVQISWGKQDIFAHFRLAALALPFIWAQLWVPFIFHLLQYFRLHKLWWKTLKRRPQFYQCCNLINHIFIPQNQHLWFEEFTQLSLRAVPDETGCGSWMCHSPGTASFLLRATRKRVAPAWCPGGTREELTGRALQCPEQLRQLHLLVSAPSLQEWEPSPPQYLPLRTWPTILMWFLVKISQTC